nr:MAG TPA: hypothetical protein [Caudoviricetes sp.]
MSPVFVEYTQKRGFIFPLSRFRGRSIEEAASFMRLRVIGGNQQQA